jgi:xanthine dehydrogenase small subunit
MAVRFHIDGEIVELADVDPTATLLDHLRTGMGRTGSKEGCAEGDCGACTVLVGEPAGDRMAWRAVNSCIQLLPMLDGKALLTVESLAGADGSLNPLQAVMAANGSSQCGFCTPGFVMSLYGRSIGAGGHALPVTDILAGNLCRCTGYGPILAAADAVPALPRDDSAALAALATLPRGDAGGRHGSRQWFAPRSAAALADLLVAHPGARIVAGATDVGLWVTKGLKTIDTLIFIGDIAELRTIDETPAGVRLGAAVRHADAHAAFARLHPDLGELLRRFGGLQVRNSGTIGGNIANGSPIGDAPPALIALGAEVTLASASSQRTLPLEDFFIAYGRQDLRPGEFVESIWIPRPGADDMYHVSKLSRRFDSDISAVCGAFKLTVRDGRISAARVAFGGMAGTPHRAGACEAALAGAAFARASFEAAAIALQGDYTPLSDGRGSAAYRRQAAANLLLRLWHRANGDAASIHDVAAAHG